MDKGKKPLTVGEWTTVQKKSNKGVQQRPLNPNTRFMVVPPPVAYYPNQGYYV